MRHAVGDVREHIGAPNPAVHNFIASVKGVTVNDLESIPLAYPPAAVTWAYFRWARTVDPLLYLNPVWWQAIEWVNMLCLTPFAMYASIAFIRGWNSARMPAVRVSCVHAMVLRRQPSDAPGLRADCHLFLHALLPDRVHRRDPVSVRRLFLLGAQSVLCVANPYLGHAARCSFGDTPSAEPATFVGVYQARASQQ